MKEKEEVGGARKEKADATPDWASGNWASEIFMPSNMWFKRTINL